MRKSQVRKAFETAVIVCLIAIGSSEVLGYCSTTTVSCDEYIYGVYVNGEDGDINTWATPCSGYTNYTSTQSASMQAGGSYYFDVVTSIVGYTDYGIAWAGDQVAIWIDWDIDGNFDSGDLCYSKTLTAEDFADFDGFIAVPSDIASGISRMRVRLIYAPLDDMDPCGYASYGEVEDYEIVLSNNKGSISGVKYNDLDADGTYDFGEELPDWEIYVDLDNDGIREFGEPNTITNDPNGVYEFTDLDPGTYTVAEVMKPGWTQTYPGGVGTHSVTVTANTITEGVNFANTDNPMPVTISGYVGVIPSVYGLKDVVVTASSGESTTTDIHGYYELTFSNPWGGTISCSKGGWGFLPSTIIYLGQSTSVANQNITAIEPATKYWGGSGTEENPYRIRTAGDLQELGSNQYDWDKHFMLFESINLSDYDGEDFNMIGFYNPSTYSLPFSGTFDGNGNTISGFKYEYVGSPQKYIGIFSMIDDGAVIQNVTVTRPEVIGGNSGVSVGTLVGEMEGGSVIGCSVDDLNIGFVESTSFWAGGLIGHVSGGTVSGCSATIDVSCTNGEAGGITGANWGGMLSGCQAEGAITGKDGVGGLVGNNVLGGIIENCQANSETVGDQQVGGLVGKNSSIIRECFSAGTVIAIGQSQSDIGGLAGRNVSGGQIENCYSSANVIGSDDCGGLVGLNWETDASEPTTISNCYATGMVTAGYPHGGLVGENIDGTISNSFFDIDTGGPDNGLGTGLGTTAMQTLGTYTTGGWDFVIETTNGTEDIWKKHYPQSYPKLNWEKYSHGTGTLLDPFLIYTPEEMNAIGANEDDLDKCFKLMADVDLSAYTGSTFNIIGNYVGMSQPSNLPFSGVFDGNEHTISNFTYSGSGTVGLFEYVGGIIGRGEIRDLTLTGVNINASGSYTGGLVGHLSGVAANCSVDGVINGIGNVGGLVGELNLGSIYDCSSRGTVNGDESVGGLVGNCYFGEVFDSYSTATVTGDSQVGGLVGIIESGELETCYAAGAVSGTTDVGGLTGFSGTGYYTDCFWDQTVNSGLSGIGNMTDLNVVGHTTTELQTEATFTDAEWDFAGEISNGPDDDWDMPSGGGYPELWWQLPSLPSLPVGMFSAGTGTLEDPYLISNATELNNIGHNSQLMNKHFRLVNDIDLEGIDLHMIGGFSSKFDGVFNGNGHKVSNFTKDPLAFGHRLGMFQAIDIDGYVENLELTDPNVGSYTMFHIYNGSLAASNYGTIRNCLINGGEVLAAYVAGGVAAENFGTITNCYSTAVVDASNASGGLVVYNDHGGLVTKSVSAGKTLGDYVVGGIVAENLKGTVSLSRFSGNIDAERWVGGIVGENTGTIVNCYSRGNITANSYAGGITGLVWGVEYPASVSNCYSATIFGESGSYGGVAGGSLYGTVTNSFCDSDLNPGIDAIGNISNTYDVTGKSTLDMQTESMFTNYGWDFYGETSNGDEDIWIINEGYGYPVHFWERVNLTGWFGTDLADFAVLSSNWLRACNLECNQCDIIEDGNIDFKDFAVIMANWNEIGCGNCEQADLTGDSNVTILDVQEFAECWIDPYDCSGGDIDFSGMVNINDLLILAEYWLE